jgi:hypothetical protein
MWTSPKPNSARGRFLHEPDFHAAVVHRRFAFSDIGRSARRITFMPGVSSPTGGDSSPLKSCFDSPSLAAGSAWISGPLSTVLRPVTLPQPTCGRTTQKVVPSRAIGAAERTSRA